MAFFFKFISKVDGKEVSFSESFTGIEELANFNDYMLNISRVYEKATPRLGEAYQAHMSHMFTYSVDVSGNLWQDLSTIRKKQRGLDPHTDYEGRGVILKDTGELSKSFEITGKRRSLNNLSLFFGSTCSYASTHEYGGSLENPNLPRRGLFGIDPISDHGAMFVEKVTNILGNATLNAERKHFKRSKRLIPEERYE